MFLEINITESKHLQGCRFAFGIGFFVRSYTAVDKDTIFSGVPPMLPTLLSTPIQRKMIRNCNLFQVLKVNEHALLGTLEDSEHMRT